jgi:hypothetical protein
MAGRTVANFSEHKLLLLTDNDYRRDKGLSPLVGSVEPDTAPRIPETNEPVVEVDPVLLRQIDAWKEERKRTRKRDEELTTLIDRAEAEAVMQYVAAGVTTLTLDGRTASVSSQLWLKKRDSETTPAEVAAALRADGLDELVQPEGYHSGQLSAWARRLEENGEPLPPHVGKLLEGRESWSIKFTSPRPTRARKRQAGVPSSILHGASTD